MTIHDNELQPDSNPAIHYAIAGLPDPVAQGYRFNVRCDNGTLDVIALAGTMGYVYRPNGKIDPQRRWVLISPMYLGLDSEQQGERPYRHYIEPLLAAGYHVAGIDIGTTCGSPAGVAIYQAFYEHVVKHYALNPKARAIGQSNGGLRVYSWAFRHPEQIGLIFGIFPVLDLRDWPGWERMFGPKSIIPPGMAYPLAQAELEARLAEFNPIDNLAPLARAGVRIFHVHGDQDDGVHLEPNSIECGRRYKALGGSFELEIVKGGGHTSTPPFYQCRRGLEFLLED
jgi:pimeloyl-ACP methyl ester carboxylesterase